MTAQSDGDAAVIGGGSTQGLRRTLGFFDLVVYAAVFMCVISVSGVFGSVFQPSNGLVVLAYVVSALVMLVTASSYSVLMERYPQAGSVYAYVGRTIAPWAGFLAGWLILLDYLSVPGLLARIAGAAMEHTTSWPVWVWVIVFTLVATVANLFGLKMTKRANVVFVVIELAVLVANLTAGVIALANGAGRGFSWDPLWSSEAFHLGALLSGVSVAAISFLGFDAMSTLVEDTRGGARQVSRAMLVGIGLLGLIFMVQSWVSALLVADPAVLIRDGDPDGVAAYTAARAALPGLDVVTALAVAVAWGWANTMVAQVATSRLVWAMARDGRGRFGSWLSQISVSRSVPRNAILLIAGITLVVGIWAAVREDGITVLSSSVSFGALLTFVLANVSVLVDRIRNGPGRAHWVRVWVLPLVGLVSLSAIVWNTNVLAQIVGFVWLGLGVLVLLWLVRTGRAPRLPGMEDPPAVGAAPVGAGSRA